MIFSDAFKLAQMVKRSGIEAFPRIIRTAPDVAYAVVVADVVACSSGSRKWSETRELSLYTADAVARYLSDIS